MKPRSLFLAVVVTVAACGAGEPRTEVGSGSAVTGAEGEPIPGWATATALPAEPEALEQPVAGDVGGPVVVDMAGGGTEHLLGALASGETDHYELLVGPGDLSVTVQDGAGAVLDATVRDDGTILAAGQATFESQLTPGQQTIDLLVKGTGQPAADYFVVITFAPA